MPARNACSTSGASCAPRCSAPSTASRACPPTSIRSTSVESGVRAQLGAERALVAFHHVNREEVEEAAETTVELLLLVQRHGVLVQDVLLDEIEHPLPDD